jgi:hypothetical protein
LGRCVVGEAKHIPEGFVPVSTRTKVFGKRGAVTVIFWCHKDLPTEDVERLCAEQRAAMLEIGAAFAAVGSKEGDSL